MMTPSPETPPKQMRAIHLQKPSTLLLSVTTPTPTPASNELLIRSHATSLTRSELTWPDTLARPFAIPGHDLSGTIAALGSAVPASYPDLSIGDTIYALTSFSRHGAAADYVIALPSEIAPKPHSLPHTLAASLPLSALTAWQALFVHAGLDRHDRTKNVEKRVLVTGAAGGVGVQATQLAHWSGAHVTGTGSTKNLEFIRELGADEAVDYTTTAFETVMEDVDIVLDCVGGSTLSKCWDVVKQEGGVLISVAEPASEETEKLHPGVKRVWFIVEPNGDQLREISTLVDDGAVKPVVDRVLPLEEAAEAHELGEKGHTRGKIILKVAEE